MAKKASCRCKPSECEECPEWIFTFADLVMLMMGFFVILWVLKPAPNPKGGKTDDEKEIKVFAAIRDAFGYVPSPASKDPIDMQMLIDKLQAMKIPAGPGNGAQSQVRPQGADGSDPDVTSIRVGRQSVVGGRLLFERGSPTPSPEMLAMLEQVANQVRGHRNIVLVKGHTSLDDLPEGASPQQKMNLSLRRAQVVADYLVANGVSPDVLRVEGCSTFEPVVQHEYTPTSQQANRRVEVEATPTLVVDLQQQPADTGAGDDTAPPAAPLP